MHRVASLLGCGVSELANPERTEDTVTGGQLIGQMRPALLKYFTRKCQNSAEAEDLTQDVLVRMLKRCTWQSHAHANHYMYRAAVNRWLDRKRRTSTRGRNVQWDDNDCQLTHEIGPERILGGEQELEQVIAALRQLPSRTRDVLLLTRLGGERQATVAETFGISESCVERQLAKALAHLASATAGRLEPGRRHVRERKSVV
jgi:RNA polymerase sigma factor (sigma-70 family)